MRTIYAKIIYQTIIEIITQKISEIFVVFVQHRFFANIFTDFVTYLQM